MIYIKGSDRGVALNQQQFRLFMILRKAEGNIVTNSDLDDLFYEDDEKDVPLASNMREVIALQLREALESIQDVQRFAVLSWNAMGYYLADAEHPELFYQGAEKQIDKLNAKQESKIRT